MSVKKEISGEMCAVKIRCCKCGGVERYPFMIFASKKASQKTAWKWFEEEGWVETKHGYVCPYCDYDEADLVENSEK